MGIRVAVAGASGYAGGELLRLLAGHPDFDLVTVAGYRQAGMPVSAVHRQLTGLDLLLEPTDPTRLADADLVFLALPHGESAVLADRLPDTVRVVDLGADHRLAEAADWNRHYPGPYAGAWIYGLPELPGQRERVTGAHRVANTGCYAAAITLALAPLIAAGAVRTDDIVAVAASGTSGAGRTSAPHLLGSEVMGDLSPYRVGAHQHVPEIKQATGATGLSLTPILAPMPRGILATVTAVAADGADPRTVLAAAYADEPFVRVLPAGSWPHTAATLGSNACHLQATIDTDSGRVIVVSALDNLGKGAAGQAVQCANLMWGLPEGSGLSSYGVAP